MKEYLVLLLHWQAGRSSGFWFYRRICSKAGLFHSKNALERI
jgi:hypothetical protein